jgi:hypothetical protein
LGNGTPQHRGSIPLGRVENPKKAVLQGQVLLHRFAGEPAMNYRAILFCSFLCAYATASAAQQSSASIDLNVMAGQPSSNEVAFAIGFNDSPPVCPEGKGALQISGGPIWFIGSPASRGNGDSTVSKPIDDETYQILIETYDCLIDVTLRAQVLRDGQWTPLLVPRSMRPSMSAKERAELVRPFLERLREQSKDGARPSAEAYNNWLQGPASLARVTRIQRQTGGLSSFYQFDEMPENCIKAVGEYSLDQKGIIFFFSTNVPDDYNRFAAQLYRFDDFRSQLVFFHNDCRVEITIAKAIRQNGTWLPIPVASIARSR